MNSLKKKMINTLIDLKENHHVISVKAEFETEGTRLEEALRLKEIVTKAGLDLTIKIGGCEARKDMYDARNIGVDYLIAPMIETAYAMKKYVQATKFIFSEEERNDIKFLINIETITGFQNLKEIIESPYFSDIAGIVLGRDDMAGSLGLSLEEVNSNEIFEIANELSKKMLEINKYMIIGGSVSTHSLPFFKKLPPKSLTRFETRKIIFDAQLALQDSNTDKGILKAIDFELMWLKNKQEFYGIIYKEDEARLQLLENRYKKLIEETGAIHA